MVLFLVSVSITTVFFRQITYAGFIGFCFFFIFIFIRRFMPWGRQPWLANLPKLKLSKPKLKVSNFWHLCSRCALSSNSYWRAVPEPAHYRELPCCRNTSECSSCKRFRASLVSEKVLDLHQQWGCHQQIAWIGRGCFLLGLALSDGSPLDCFFFCTCYEKKCYTSKSSESLEENCIYEHRLGGNIGEVLVTFDILVSIFLWPFDAFNSS